MLAPGTVILNRYTVERVIGSTGMSTVYLARSDAAASYFAVKEVGVSSVALKSLETEIGVLKELRHPGLINIVDAVRTDDALLYVMDYAGGCSMEQAVNDGRRFTEDDLVDYCLQLADILGYLHTREPSLVYRDLKPSNIMMTDNDRIVLIDLGTVRSLSGDIGVGEALGTEGYAAPEQYGPGSSPDARSDIYAFGRVLSFMLRHTKRGKYRHALEMIAKRCCSENPDDRYQDCGSLYSDLRHCKQLVPAFRMIKLSALLVFLLFTGCAVFFAYMWFNDSIYYLYELLVFGTASALSFRLFDIPSACAFLLGTERKREARTRLESVRLNGVMDINEYTGFTDVVTWDDVILPYDDRSVQIRLGYDNAGIRLVRQEEFVLEKEILFSCAESYSSMPSGR